MKTKIFLSALFLIAIMSFSSCSDKPTEQPPTATNEIYIDATSKTTWHYFSLSENKVVGSGEENDTANASWAARKDWDIAVNRYSIRTNSGAATTVSAQGGVYTFDAATTFNAVANVPTDAIFIADKAVTSEGMGGVITTVKSEATVILFKKNEDGSTVMPPVYLQAPIYIFRTASGTQHYKVKFTQYQNENKATGHVKFYSAKI